MNASEKELRSNVETLKGASGKLPKPYYFYSRPADFVLREGEFFKPKPLPKNIKAQKIKFCFHNSLLISAGHGFRYVEGYALHKGELPVLHAWNIDSEGSVVDTTWKPIGRAYLGVVLPILDSSNWKGSLIDDWENGWPLLRKRRR